MIDKEYYIDGGYCFVLHLGFRSSLRDAIYISDFGRSIQHVASMIEYPGRKNPAWPIC